MGKKSKAKESEPNVFRTTCRSCGVILEENAIADATLKNSVAESLQIWIGTVTFGAILMGFVFTTLSYILSIKENLTNGQQVVVWFLVLTMILLLGGLVLFHFTANQVIAFWNIFFPESKLRSIGGVLFGFGISMLLWSVAVMLYVKSMYWLVAITVVAGVGQLGFVIIKGRIHKGQPYVRAVDGSKPSQRIVSSDD